MNGIIMKSLMGIVYYYSIVFCLICILPHSLIGQADANSEVDALVLFKGAITSDGPYHAMKSWNSTSDNPCSWFHIICNNKSEVVIIDLGLVGLEGSLVPSLGNLKNLKRLELYGNSLSGSIPPELGNLKKLTHLELYQNKLTGIIPIELAKMPKLKFLRLYNNNLSGCAPDDDLFELSRRKCTVQIFQNPNLCSSMIPTGDTCRKQCNY